MWSREGAGGMTGTGVMWNRGEPLDLTAGDTESGFRRVAKTREIA